MSSVSSGTEVSMLTVSSSSKGIWSGGNAGGGAGGPTSGKLGSLNCVGRMDLASSTESPRVKSNSNASQTLSGTAGAVVAQKKQLEWPALPRQRGEQHPTVHGTRGQQDSRPHFHSRER